MSPDQVEGQGSDSVEGSVTTYVIVHGGFDGGWSWKDVATRMRKQGVEVYTPSLTGSGERAHLLSRDVNLETHIQDIVNVLIYNDLNDVILIGHSYGGMVITGVADRLPERLAHLVYLDALVVENGENMMDAVGPEFSNWLLERANSLGDGWRVPHDPPDADRRTDFPLKAFQQPLTVGNSTATGFSNTYIRCAESNNPILQQMAERAQQKGWDCHELNTGHMPMWTMPEELTALLL
jgi:pimeloyl-ACP methyl ester carboxylesterase